MVSQLYSLFRKHIARQNAFSTSIAVAMSGGIDSSVTAYLLKQQGYDVVGVFMRNWDQLDEAGQANCTLDSDFQDMKKVCERLGIRYVEVSFMKEYWNNVFVPFIEAYETGSITPNPDVACNRHIKFNKLQDYVKKNMGIDVMSTGHYVRNILNSEGKSCLFRGKDLSKDQSYFLSTTEGSQLKNVIFPVGGISKTEVRSIAEKCFSGLSVLSKKESMGVCFIGKRDMKDFLLHYISKHANICRLIDITNGRVILSGRDAAHHMYDTIGQRARLGGMPIKYFVARKDASNGDIFLAPGSEHPSLYCNSVDIVYSDFNWIHGMFPSRLIPSTISLHEEAVIHCTCQYRHLQSGVSCSVRLMRKPKSSCSASPSSLSPLPLSTLLFSRYLTQPEIGQNVQVVGLSATSSKSTISIGSPSEESSICSDGLWLRIDFTDRPMRGVSPGQILVLYDGEECLGGGAITNTFSSYFDS